MATELAPAVERSDEYLKVKLHAGLDTGAEPQNSSFNAMFVVFN